MNPHVEQITFNMMAVNGKDLIALWIVFAPGCPGVVSSPGEII